MEEQKTLTNKEVVAELRKMVKPYIGIGMQQSQFSKTCISIEHDLAKLKTMKEFFAKFNFTGSWDSWIKSRS